MIPTTDPSGPYRGFNLGSYVLKQLLNLLRYILRYFKNCILRQDLAMLLKLAWSLRSPYLRLPVRWHCRTMAPCSAEHAHFKMDTNLQTLATCPVTRCFKPQFWAIRLHEYNSPETPFRSVAVPRGWEVEVRWWTCGLLDLRQGSETLPWTCFPSGGHLWSLSFVVYIYVYNHSGAT